MSEHLTVIHFVDFLFSLESFFSIGWNSGGLRFQADFNKELIQAILEFKPKVFRRGRHLVLSLPEADFVFSI